MSDVPGTPRSRAADYGNGFQVTAVVIVVTGVMLLATAAFLVSYAGIRQIAVASGISPALAGLYPLIVDAALVVACVAAPALRGAGWWMQGYAWLSVIFLLAVVAGAGAVHAAGISLPHRPAAAAAAALPWVLFLLGFWLCLSMLRHLRTTRAANRPGHPGAAPWWPWNADPDTADATPLPAQPKVRRRPGGPVVLAGFVAAAVLCAGGVSMAVFGLASGTRTDTGATVIPASVATALPRLSHVHGIRALARSVPVSVRIPAIGVSAPVMKLGKNPDGTVQVPPLADHNLTGWYQYGPAPGQPGPAVILGHVDSATGISVFYHLKDLRRGDRIYVTLADEKVTAFAVDGVQKAAKDAFPTAAVYAEGDYPGLRLITCGGPFDLTTGHYLDNIVIYAHMIVLRSVAPDVTPRGRPPNPRLPTAVLSEVGHGEGVLVQRDGDPGEPPHRPGQVIHSAARPGHRRSCPDRRTGWRRSGWRPVLAGYPRAMSSCAIPAAVRGATVHGPA